MCVWLYVRLLPYRRFYPKNISFKYIYLALKTTASAAKREGPPPPRQDRAGKGINTGKGMYNADKDNAPSVPVRPPRGSGDCRKQGSSSSTQAAIVKIRLVKPEG